MKAAKKKSVSNPHLCKAADKGKNHLPAPKPQSPINVRITRQK